MMPVTGDGDRIIENRVVGFFFTGHRHRSVCFDDDDDDDNNKSLAEKK